MSNTTTIDEPTTSPRHIAAVELVAIESPNLDTVCYRGSATLADLARISQADVFDEVNNTNGLQRDLSPKHAREAYDYATREPDEEFPRAWPEVFINVRDEHVVSVEPINTGRQRQVKAFKFIFDMDAVRDDIARQAIAVSRVDGNHRLWFGAGDDKRTPAEVDIPFQLHIGLSPKQEANLFTDVNANQKGLNSSHLHVLRSRLTPEEQELREHPERVFARRLAEDDESPWKGLVYMGGSKAGIRERGESRPISFVTLEQGVRRTLSKSQYIHDLPNPDAQYVLIRNYWSAVHEVMQEAWGDPKEYLLLKNLGVLSFSILAGTIIDRCMARGEVTKDNMKVYVEQVADRFDWHRDARGERSLSGMSGNRAALLVSGEMAAEIVDPGESEATRSIQDRLLQEVVPHTLPDEEGTEEKPDVSDLVGAGVQASV